MDVEVDLVGSGMAKYMTNDEGKYEFMEMPIGGSYQVIPKKDDGLLDGCMDGCTEGEGEGWELGCIDGPAEGCTDG